MSWTWLTGKMTKESAKTHHAKWYEDEVMERESEMEEEGEGMEAGLTSRIGGTLAE
jgi:hypothetical protein